jgi:hypothetical protein
MMLLEKSNKEAMLVVDEDGLPIAGAKVEYNILGNKVIYSKDALVTMYRNGQCI